MIKVGSKYRIIFDPELVEENDTLHRRVCIILRKEDDDYWVKVDGDENEYIIYEHELVELNGNKVYLATNAVNSPED